MAQILETEIESQLDEMSKTRYKHFDDLEELRGQLSALKSSLEQGDLQSIMATRDCYVRTRDSSVRSARLEIAKEYLSLIAQYEVRRKSS